MKEVASTNAAIHDLGYQRYEGERRAQSTRWRVILRNVITTSWRGWWRLKLWLIGAAMTIVAIGVVMYVARAKIIESLQLGGMPATFADGLIPLSFRFLTPIAFILGLTIGTPTIARDLRAGAFEFYFSRPVRPLDYVLGKIGGLASIVGLVLFVGPVLLGLFRVGLSQNMDELGSSLVIVPKLAMVGFVATIAYSTLSLGLSALSDNPRHTMAAWAVLYIVAGGMATGLSRVVGVPALAALDLPVAVLGLAFGSFDASLFEFGAMPSVAACFASLFFYSVLGIGLAFWRLRRAERAGLGGG